MNKNMRTLLTALPFIAYTLTGCAISQKSRENLNSKNHNAVSLFNGINTTGWHTYLKDHADSCWRAEDGLLTLDHSYAGGGSLVTDKEYRNFILTLDWKVRKAGNSGILINVIEDPKYDRDYKTGPEMQVLDNKDASDNKKDTHLAGSLYGLVTCNPDYVHPAGEWNSVKIKQVNGALTLWINNHEITHIQIGSQKWNDLVAKSKFSTMPGFGKSIKGHISLQDHGHPVWYRNIKIQEL